MKAKSKLARLLLVASLTLALVLGGTSAAFAGQNDSNDAAAKFEIDFMKNMIDHHAMAVHMAEMCESRAIHQELKDLCKKIGADQAKEIEMLQSWLKKWYGVDYEPKSIEEMHMMHLQQMGQMDAQEMQDHMAHMAGLSGKDFEIHFMKMMIHHHQDAIDMAKDALVRARHCELKNFAQKVIKVQSEEIAKMTEWLSKWYGTGPEMDHAHNMDMGAHDVNQNMNHDANHGMDQQMNHGTDHETNNAVHKNDKSCPPCPPSHITVNKTVVKKVVVIKKVIVKKVVVKKAKVVKAKRILKVKNVKRILKAKRVVKPRHKKIRTWR